MENIGFDEAPQQTTDPEIVPAEELEVFQAVEASAQQS